MKVNLATGHLVGFTGSETWTYTMAKYLARKYDVHVYTPRLGMMSDKIDFCTVSDQWRDCELAIVNHQTTLDVIPRGTPMIYTSHSAFLQIEQFPDRECKWVAMSEEIAANRIMYISPQPIDFERFKPTKINKTPEKILYFCNVGYAQGRKIVEEAFPDKELIFIEEHIFDIENVIKEADVVIGIGRCAYEALAMGKNVISADWRSYQNGFGGGGMITEDNFKELNKANLTGRNHYKAMDSNMLREELKKYDPERKIDMSEHDAEKVADKYIQLWLSM
jgi:hypothetical protein